MFSEFKVTEIYCMVNDFLQGIYIAIEKYMILKKSKHCNQPNHINDTEIRTIFILFHSDGFHCSTITRSMYTNIYSTSPYTKFPTIVLYN